jgi:hypothetical protein
LSSACGSVWRVSWISRRFGGRNLDVDQLQGGELLQDASWDEARGERGQPSCQGGVQTIGEEGGVGSSTGSVRNLVCGAGLAITL